MKKQILISVVASLLAISASAQHLTPGGKIGALAQKCLQMSSNADLLNEINRRMSYVQQPQPIADENAMTLTCNYNTLVVTATNLQTGKTSTSNFTMSNGTQCENLRAKLENRLNVHNGNAQLVAECNYNTLQRYVIGSDKTINQIESTSYSNGTQCEAAAAQINK